MDVVILTWNDGALLARAVESARRSVGVAARVIVVDNGSDPPASVDGEATLVRLPTNAGVAVGRNRGAREAGADALCFLDSDAELTPDCLATLAGALGDGAVAMAVPVFDAQAPDASAGMAPGLLRKAVRFLGHSSTYAGGVSFDADGRRDVEFGIGACQLVRRAAFLEVGGNDERYFYGPEDIDLCLRLRTAGWRVVQVAGAGCIHPPRRRNRNPVRRETLRHAGAYARHYVRWRWSQLRA